MEVQFAGSLAADLNEENIRHFEATEDKDATTVAKITVAEFGKEKQFHSVEIWGKEKLHKHLTKGKIVQVKGDMSYTVDATNNKDKRKYYAVKNAHIDLIANPQSKET